MSLKLWLDFLAYRYEVTTEECGEVTQKSTRSSSKFVRVAILACRYQVIFDWIVNETQNKARYIS
jgi:hypothetical protein